MGSINIYDLDGKIFVTGRYNSTAFDLLENTAKHGNSLSRADLAGKSLKGINLKGADLSGASFVCADLSNANLKGANLEAADLTGAKLEGADMSNANLKGANLEGANLFGANLHLAHTEGANFKGSTIGDKLYRVKKEKEMDKKIKLKVSAVYSVEYGDDVKLIEVQQHELDYARTVAEAIILCRVDTDAIRRGRVVFALVGNDSERDLPMFLITSQEVFTLDFRGRISGKAADEDEIMYLILAMGAVTSDKNRYGFSPEFSPNEKAFSESEYMGVLVGDFSDIGVVRTL